MTENAKKFLEQASQDEALKAELEAEIQKAQAEAAKKIASAHGFNLADEDLKAEKDEKMAALSDDELKAVAGGSTCVCVIAGAGAGKLDCGCGIVGGGHAYPDTTLRCFCAAGGGGQC